MCRLENICKTNMPYCFLHPNGLTDLTEVKIYIYEVIAFKQIIARLGKNNTKQTNKAKKKTKTNKKTDRASLTLLRYKILTVVYYFKVPR